MYDDVALSPADTAVSEASQVPALTGGDSRHPRRAYGSAIAKYGKGSVRLGGKQKGDYGPRKKLFLEVMTELEKHGRISMRNVIVALYDKAVGNTRKGDVEAAKELLNRRFGRVKQTMEVKDTRAKDPKERDRLIALYLQVAGPDRPEDTKLLEGTEITDTEFADGDHDTDDDSGDPF